MKLLHRTALCLILAWGCSGTGSDNDIIGTDLESYPVWPGGCPKPLGTITFSLTNNTSITRYIKGEWPLELFRADGILVPFDHEPVCTGVCHLCEPVNCGSCPTEATAILPGETVELEWDGRMYGYGWPLATCEGDYGHVECEVESCAPAGFYLLEFCAATNVSEYHDDMGGCPQTGIMSELGYRHCFSVLFEFEGGGTVELSLTTIGFGP